MGARRGVGDEALMTTAATTEDHRRRDAVGEHDPADELPIARTPASPGLRALYALLAVILVAYGISLVARGQNGPSWDWLDGWGPCVFETIVSLLIIVRGMRCARDRKYALLLGVASLLWALGDYVATYLGDNAPTLALNNYLWAGFFPLAYLGVMVLMQRDVKKLTAANYLDGVVATLITAAALAAFAFGPIVAASGGGSEFVAVNIVYPVGDLLLLALTLFGVMLLAPGHRARWGLLAVAGAVNAAGDIAALFNGLVATDVGWFINVMAWPVSLLLISWAVCLAPDPRVPVKENTASGFQVPAAASALALVILFVGSLTHASEVAIAFAIATLLAAGARFALALKRLNELNAQRHNELAVAAEGERQSKHALQLAVRSYAEFASRVADGDLTATVTSDALDLRELGESLNTMVTGLADISTEIQAGVQEIGASTAEILGSVRHHTESAGRQSAALTQTTATINELRQAADDTAQRAREVAAQAADSVRVSDEGTTAVAAIADAMREIRVRVSGVTDEIVTLSGRAEQIGVITDTVNELSDRSNLLALNATIEAARAGEHGRGFAVVADQVRALAEQSRQATAKVQTILDEVREATAAAVSASEDGALVVEQGLELTARADDGIRHLAGTLREAAAAAEQIAASAHQQSVGIDEIAASMNHMEEGTTQFLEGAEASEVAAQSLNELSAKLSALADRYRVGA
jgi:methyl-accepting chemotaxis protein